MDGRRLKAAMAEGELVVGTMITDLWSPAIAPILAAADFDFFVLDMEHGPFGLEGLTAIALASRGANIAPIVRIPWHTRENVQRPLDAGAAGLLVPGVESREMIEQIGRWAKYAPDGERGVALRRAHTAYRQVDTVAYMAEANASTILVAQIETVRGVERIDEICTVPGVDGLLIGTNDLSQSLGVPGQISHSSVVQAIERVTTAGRARKLAVGIHLRDTASLRRWMAAGMRWMMLSTEVSLLADAALGQVQELKSGRTGSTRH